MRKLWPIFLLVVLCLSIPTALAQDSAPATLTYGQVSIGQINDDSPTAAFTFEGRQADTIYISVFDSSFSVTLRLTGPTGVPMENSEDNMLVDTLIGPITLPADGTYTVTVERPEWESEGGNFQLLADIAEVVQLEPGATLDGELGQGEVRFFTTNLTAGNIISYTLNATNVGIRLMSPGGDTFLYEGYYDDLSGLFNYAPESGSYFGMIQTIEPGGTAFTLHLGVVKSEPLTPGTSVSGSIGDGEQLVFTFDSAAEKLWHASVTTDPVDDGQANLEIHKPDMEYYYGGSLAWDCCSGPNDSPRIDPFSAPEDGTYYVVFTYTNWDEGGTVDYTLTLTPSTLVSLAPGTSITQTVSPESGNVTLAYNGTEGEAVRVTLRVLSGEGRPGIEVMSPDDDVLSFSGYETRAASFEFEITVTGLYLFEIRNMNYDDSEMEFSLTLEQLAK
jgi:hypothetical protein